jgi:isoleucyl-tRNA synthetase
MSSKSKARRSAQTAIWLALNDILKLCAPIMAFTSEEAYMAMPGKGKKAESIHCLNFPEPNDEWLDRELADRFDGLFKIRDEVNKVLDAAQKKKDIGHPLEARVELAAGEKDRKLLESFSPSEKGEEDLIRLFLVSEIELVDDIKAPDLESEEVPGLKVKMEKAAGEKCERCWTYVSDVGENKEHPTICGRCLGVLEV